MATKHVTPYTLYNELARARLLGQPDPYGLGKMFADFQQGLLNSQKYQAGQQTYEENEKIQQAAERKRLLDEKLQKQRLAIAKAAVQEGVEKFIIKGIANRKYQQNIDAELAKAGVKRGSYEASIIDHNVAQKAVADAKDDYKKFGMKIMVDPDTMSITAMDNHGEYHDIPARVLQHAAAALGDTNQINALHQLGYLDYQEGRNAATLQGRQISAAAAANRGAGTGSKLANLYNTLEGRAYLATEQQIALMERAKAAAIAKGTKETPADVSGFDVALQRLEARKADLERRLGIGPGGTASTDLNSAISAFTGSGRRVDDPMQEPGGTPNLPDHLRPKEPQDMPTPDPMFNNPYISQMSPPSFNPRLDRQPLDTIGFSPAPSLGPDAYTRAIRGEDGERDLTQADLVGRGLLTDESILELESPYRTQ